MIYRDGASEGSFEELIRREMGAVRRAFYELGQEKVTCTNPNPENCAGNGCIFCTPPITFIAAQKDHNIRIVPSQKSGDSRKIDNVPSGTVVDTIVTSFRNGLKLSTEAATEAGKEARLRCFEDANDDGFDFLLVAQGGLKGTSKPMYYRVLLNENAVWKPEGGKDTSPLTKEALQTMTYHMAFQCKGKINSSVEHFACNLTLVTLIYRWHRHKVPS